MTRVPKRPDKTCPACARLMPFHNDHCYSCGYDYPRETTDPDAVDDGDGPMPPIRIWSYPGRTQADAALAFERHAKQLAEKGYIPVAQSWGEGRPGVGRVLALGMFAGSLRPDGFLTVTYQLRPEPPLVERDALDQLKRLAELRDAGIVTDEEFLAKKADLLARL